MSKRDDKRAIILIGRKNSGKTTILQTVFERIKAEYQGRISFLNDNGQETVSTCNGQDFFSVFELTIEKDGVIVKLLILYATFSDTLELHEKYLYPKLDNDHFHLVVAPITHQNVLERQRNLRYFEDRYVVQRINTTKRNFNGSRREEAEAHLENDGKIEELFREFIRQVEFLVELLRAGTN